MSFVHPKLQAGPRGKECEDIFRTERAFGRWIDGLSWEKGEPTNGFDDRFYIFQHILVEKILKHGPLPLPHLTISISQLPIGNWIIKTSTWTSFLLHLLQNLDDQKKNLLLSKKDSYHPSKKLDDEIQHNLLTSLIFSLMKDSGFFDSTASGRWYCRRVEDPHVDWGCRIGEGAKGAAGLLQCFGASFFFY